jgi:hypothetical protein
VIGINPEQLGKPAIDALKPFIAIDDRKPNRGVIVESVQFELRVRHFIVAVDLHGPDAEQRVGVRGFRRCRQLPGFPCRSMGSGAKRKPSSGVPSGNFVQGGLVMAT